MKEMEFISTKKRQVQQLCAEAAMDFNLEKWLGHLEAVVAYNKRVQMFHSQLKPGVKGKLENMLCCKTLVLSI